jgi:hypothetical protein
VTVQLAGATTAFQDRSIRVEEAGVAAREAGAAGAVLQVPSPPPEEPLHAARTNARAPTSTVRVMGYPWAVTVAGTPAASGPPPVNKVERETDRFFTTRGGS